MSQERLQLPDFSSFLGINVGGTSIDCAIGHVDDDGVYIDPSEVFSYPSPDDQYDAERMLCEIIQHTVAQRRAIGAVGVAYNGLVEVIPTTEHETRLMLRTIDVYEPTSYVISPGTQLKRMHRDMFNAFDPREALRDMPDLNVPIYVVNDCVAAAHGMQLLSMVGANENRVGYINIGSGVGAAVVERSPYPLRHVWRTVPADFELGLLRSDPQNFSAPFIDDIISGRVFAEQLREGRELADDQLESIARYTAYLVHGLMPIAGLDGVQIGGGVVAPHSDRLLPMIDEYFREAYGAGAGGIFSLNIVYRDPDVTHELRGIPSAIRSDVLRLQEHASLLSDSLPFARDSLRQFMNLPLNVSRNTSPTPGDDVAELTWPRLSAPADDRYFQTLIAPSGRQPHIFDPKSESFRTMAFGEKPLRETLRWPPAGQLELDYAYKDRIAAEIDDLVKLIEPAWEQEFRAAFEVESDDINTVIAHTIGTLAAFSWVRLHYDVPYATHTLTYDAQDLEWSGGYLLYYEHDRALILASALARACMLGLPLASGYESAAIDAMQRAFTLPVFASELIRKHHHPESTHKKERPQSAGTAAIQFVEKYAEISSVPAQYIAASFLTSSLFAGLPENDESSQIGISASYRAALDDMAYVLERPAADMIVALLVDMCDRSGMAYNPELPANEAHNVRARMLLRNLRSDMERVIGLYSAEGEYYRMLYGEFKQIRPFANPARARAE